MRTTIRTLLAATLLGGFGANAQNTLIIEGTVAGCTPLQQVTVTSQPGTVPAFSWTFDLNPFTCGYDTIVEITSPSAAVLVSTTCTGTTLTDGDTATFNFVNDTVLMVIGLACVGGGAPDCQGVPNGPDLPGTACDDGDPGTTSDTWDMNCVCSGVAIPTCQASFTIANSSPWVMNLDNTSTGLMPILYDWTLPDGSSTGQNSPFFVFTTPGTYGVCLTIVTWDNCTSSICDTVYVDTAGNVSTTPIILDCVGMVNGPNMPGTPCNDNDPNTINDTWDANCVCAGTAIGACQALFAIQQTNPWIIATTNLSTGVAPITYSWWMPDGSTSTQFEPDHVFTSTGVYAICLSISDGGGCTSTTCDTLFMDSLGFMYTGIPLIDCFGVPWGPALSGTACDDGDPNTINDTWNVNCACVGYAGNVDCLGITNGPNMPGTACTDSVNNWSYSGIWGNNCLCTPISWMDCNGVQNGPDLPGNWCDDGDPNTVGDVWDANCNCAGQGGGWVDCLGIPNGTAMPGTPCDDGDPNTFNDTWNGNCSCVGSGGLPCEADFIVTQAYDSLQGPIPGTIWVFFLNNGGQGFTYSWDFGDGTTSNVPFPTHTYSGNGPYLLCLTVSGFGCTDTFCDTVGVDANGIILPMGAQSQGFTINVMGGANSIHEAEVLSEVAIAPNPVNDVLTLALNSTRSGALLLEVLDVTGKLIHQQRANLAAGANTLRLDLGHLEAGSYLLRLNADGITRTERFVRGY